LRRASEQTLQCLRQRADAGERGVRGEEPCDAAPVLCAVWIGAATAAARSAASIVIEDLSAVGSAFWGIRHATSECNASATVDIGAGFAQWLNMMLWLVTNRRLTHEFDTRRSARISAVLHHPI
jgi:hypothetical protein